MISIKFKVGSGSIVDAYDTYHLIYLSSDNVTSAPSKELESTSYPEEEGEHVSDITASAAFDYKTTFLVEGTTLADVNSKVAAFNNAIMTYNSTTHLRRVSKLTLYNAYKGVMIVGYPKPLAEATEMWRDSTGQSYAAAKVELVMRVAKPSDCNFSYTPQS